ncbi:MAG: tyrosine-protein phosphatase [Acidimicrobiales bacterium]
MSSDVETYDRHLPFETVFNFRDLGGYPAADGRTVKWRTVFRADGLHRLSGADVALFADLGVRTVLDLRTHAELEERGRIGAGGEVEVHWHHLPLMDVHWDPDAYDEALGADRYLADRYLDMLETGRAGIAGGLRIIADRESTPLVFHCAAGKDRTGVLAALTLSLLGVSDDDVAADYALSTLAVERFTAWMAVNAPEVLEELAKIPEAFTRSPVEAMRLFLGDLRARYGSVVGYAADVGVDRAAIGALRDQLLT